MPVITETKLNHNFPSQQFSFQSVHWWWSGYHLCKKKACKELRNYHSISGNFRGLKINLQKTKWLICGGYNPNKSNISYF